MTTCVLTGVGGEYPLAPLAQHLRGQGLTCIEVDMAVQPLEFAGRPQGDVVLVTSCHPFIDRAAYCDLYGVEAPVSAVPEQLGFLRPRRCCFVPHDLAEPLKDTEIPFVPLFDALLMPGPQYWWLGCYTEVHEVGWIKAASAASRDSAAGGILFLPSEIGYYARLGGKAFAERFAPVLRHQPRVKLPVFAGSAVIEEALARAGTKLIPAQESTGELIAAADVVVSNGLSSVLVEAALAGRDAICIADGVHPLEAQHAAFARYPGVNIISIAEADAALSDGRAQNRQTACIKPFDYDLAARVILGNAAA